MVLSMWDTASLGVEGMLFFSSSDFQKHIVNFIPVSLDIDVVVTAWEVWTFKVVINAGVKEVDWIFKVESITDVFASLVVNTYVSEDTPWGVDGKLTEKETRVDWSTEDVINWVDDGMLIEEVSLLVWSMKYVLASVVLNKNVDALVFGAK